MAYKKMKNPSDNRNKSSNKKNSKLKKPKRPLPKMLGTGMAREAAETALKRKKKMEDIWKDM